MMYEIECIEHIDKRIKISITNLETMEETGTLDLTQEDALMLYQTLENYFYKQKLIERRNKCQK